MWGTSDSTQDDFDGTDAGTLNPSGYWGARPEAVAGAVARFLADLRAKITHLDAGVGAWRTSSAERKMIVQALAFAHGEWIRIHPFVNCKGTTARLLLVWLGARYGLGSVIQSKPTPSERAACDGRVFTYVDAAIRQMAGDDTPMEAWLSSRLTLLAGVAARDRGESSHRQIVVPQEGLEPPTPSLRMTCSTN